MEQLLNELISTIVQVILFALIPFLFYLFRKDKLLSFKKFVGLYPPSGQSVLYIVLPSLLFLLSGLGIFFLDENVKNVMLSPNSIAGRLRTMGFSTSTIIILLLTAWVKTSFAEELFFRGFLARQLVRRLGLQVGNLLQALIFGLIHLLLFGAMIKATMLSLVLIFGFSTIAGWIIGYVKEKHANGSMIPGWIAHGLGNTLSYLSIAFIL